MRRATQFIIAVILVVAIAAPLAATGQVEESTSSGTAAEPTSESFPVTIEHAHGTTEIPSAPERVVSVGYSDHDILLALDVVPVGVRDWYGNFPHATWPWAQDELGSGEPEIIGSGELDIEAIAALDPDLIVGVNTAMEATVYDLLSQVAPTIGPNAEYPSFGTPWQVRTRMIGRAVGKSDEAEQRIRAIEDRFAEVREAHPEFDGKSIAVAFTYQGQPGAYASRDTRSRLLEHLGFEVPSEYDELAGESFFASFSAERMDLLDTDVIVWLASSDEGIQTIKELPMRTGVDAVSEGREIFLGKLLGGAFSFSSPLSIPFLLEQLVPALAAAVDGDPETRVPEELR